MTRSRLTGASPQLIPLDTTNHKEQKMHGKVSAVASLVLAAIASIALCACSLQSTATGAAVSHAPKGLTLKRAAAPTSVTEKVCIDPTTSSYPDFSEGVRQDVIGVLAAWAPPKPTKAPTAAVGATASLTMWVREVTTHSFDTNQASLELTIPGTPALAPPPNITDPNLGTDQLTWNAREQRWAATVRAAHIAATAAVAQLRGYRLEDTAGNWSAISACIAALASEGAENAAVRFLLATDLEENRPPVAASYEGAPFLIDQSCPDSAAACAARAARWKVRLERQGAGSIAVVRADAAVQVIRAWLLEGRS